MAEHRADLPRPRIIAPSELRLTPWKNGLGTTADVLLFPEGSSHDTFDIRVSLATITSESDFSAFPGVDRWITRLGRNRLSLVFDDGDVRALSRMEPLLFDSARTTSPFSPRSSRTRSRPTCGGAHRLSRSRRCRGSEPIPGRGTSGSSGTSSSARSSSTRWTDCGISIFFPAAGRRRWRAWAT